MKRVCIAMCVLAIVFCSCQKENLNSKIGDASITAFAPSETKTSIDGVHVTWNSGDKIQVWEKNTTNSGVYKLANGAGTGLGSFDFESGTPVANENFVGIYPTDNVDVFASSIRRTISFNQDGDLTNEIPMYGSFVNDGTGKYKIQFNHAFGIVRIILSGDAEKVEKCKAIRFSTFNSYNVKNCFKIDKDEKLAYEVRGSDVKNQIDVSFPDITAVDGKKTIDVLFAPTINSQSQPINVSCSVWFKESLNSRESIASNSADLLVTAGKIKVINVNFKND